MVYWAGFILAVMMGIATQNIGVFFVVWIFLTLSTYFVRVLMYAPLSAILGIVLAIFLFGDDCDFDC